MSDIIFATKLKQLRKEKGLTMEELANKIGRTKSTISRWEKGERSPKMFEMVKLEQIFGVPAEQMLYDDGATSNTTIAKITATSAKLHEPRQIIVLDTAKAQLLEQNAEIEQAAKKPKDDGKIMEIADYQVSKNYDYYDHAASAGTGQYLVDVQKEQITLPVDYPADFVIPLSGDSMEPDYHSGDYIFVEQTFNLSDGDIGVFDLEGDAYVKELQIDDEGAYLHSLNPEYKDIHITPNSDFRIIGKVIGRYAEKY